METWLPVVGFEGLYEVSDLGRVRSMPRAAGKSHRGQRVLKLFPDPDGYSLATLSKAGKQRQRRVHQLVLEAFVGPAPDGAISLHRDGTRANNVPSNLRWGTHRLNSADRDAQGRGPLGERNPKAKLTTTAVAAIRADTRVARLVAADFRVHHTTISSIRRGDTWRAA